MHVTVRYEAVKSSRGYGYLAFAPSRPGIVAYSDVMVERDDESLTHPSVEGLVFDFTHDETLYGIEFDAVGDILPRSVLDECAATGKAELPAEVRSTPAGGAAVVFDAEKPHATEWLAFDDDADAWLGLDIDVDGRLLAIRVDDPRYLRRLPATVRSQLTD